VAGEERGDALRHGRRPLQVQQVGGACNRASLQLPEPGAEQRVAVREPPLGLRAQRRQHRLGDGRRSV
jgi:hypothetical protein